MKEETLLWRGSTGYNILEEEVHSKGNVTGLLSGLSRNFLIKGVITLVILHHHKTYSKESIDY